MKEKYNINKNSIYPLTDEEKLRLYTMIEKYSSESSSEDSFKENLKELKKENILDKTKHRKGNKNIHINIDDKENTIKKEEDIIIESLEDTITVNNLVYKKYKKFKNPKSKNDILAVYKCKFNRKNEKYRNKNNLGSFCNGTCVIKNKIINNKEEKIVVFSKPHSKECVDMHSNNINNIGKIIDDYNKFKDEVYQYLNSINIYNRKECKSKIEDIYNSKKFNFELKKTTIINLINKYKESSIKFTKYQALADHRIVFKEDPKKLKPIQLEYFIWANNLNISHLRKAEQLFIDATFHVPYEFHQNLIIMYKDIITGEKYPCFYILMNKKNILLYNLVFQAIIAIITQNDIYPIIANHIITDAESALLHVVKNYFKNSLNFICLYHYKKDIIDNARTIGLMKKQFINETHSVINELTKLAIYYNGDLDYVYNKLDELKKLHPNYHNLITNYFIKYKIKFFISREIDYSLLPPDCRTNNSLENYNKIMKECLGKHRFIHWINFLNFIKGESSRIKKKY